jgi:flagellin
MRAQITGLEVAQKNAKDGISLVQTAEGALTEVHSMLNRMFELAEQSANGTYDSTLDRTQLQKEVGKLKEEINRIRDSANFNGQALLDGSLAGGGNGSLGVQLDSSQTAFDSINLGTNGADNDAIKYKVEGQGVGGTAIATLTVGSDAYTATINSSSTTSLTFTKTGGTETITATLTDAGLTAAKAAAAASTYSPADVAESQVGTASSSAGGGGLTLQIGDTSDSFNQMNVSVSDIKTDKLGVSGGTASGDADNPVMISDIDISTQTGAQKSLDVIKAAINYVSDIRGELGATQNRLEHTINNLSVMQENMQDAESTIRDTDVADEMMKYTKNSILVQSAQAMLAQANQQPQGVLQLLQ